MKTKIERRCAFRKSLSSLLEIAASASSETVTLATIMAGQELGDVMRMFDAESEEGFNQAKWESDRVNAALTIADSTNWVQFAVSTRKAAADVLENYLNGEPSEVK